jgi:hypothetical protein
MRNLRLALVAASLASLVACQSGPSVGQPTPPCGGFHLRVINQSSTTVNVEINQTPALSLGPGDEKVLGQYLPPQQPDMPWTVDVTRSMDGSEIGTSHFVSGPDRDLFVNNNGLDEKSFAPPTPAC